MIRTLEFTRTTNPKTQKQNQKKDTLFRKKERHTIQNQITINLNGEIIHKSTHCPGSHHDYKIYKSKHPTLPEELMVFYDLGYLGVERDFPKQISILPYKKKRGKKLTDSQKEWNKA